MCAQASRLITSYADYTVDPCDDFYSHVCGHWLHEQRRPSTFMLDAADMFQEKRHALLSAGTESSDPNIEVLETARAYYVSCLKAFQGPVDIKKAVREVVAELEIPLRQWLVNNTWEELFAYSFNLSYINHFHNFFKINRYTTASEGTYFVIARAWSFHRIMGKDDPSNDTAEYLRRVLSSIGEYGPGDEVISEVVKFDEGWKDRQGLEGAPLSPKKIGDLSCGPFTAELWTKHFMEHGGTAETRVKASDFDKVCADLQGALVNATPVARCLHLVAVLSANVLSYDFKLIASRTNDTLRATCLNSGMRVFKEMWLRAMSMMFSIKRPVIDRFKSYTDFETRLLPIIASRTWMNLGDRTRSEGKIANFTVLLFPSSVMTVQELQCSRFGQGRLLVTNSFIENYVDIYKLETHPSCIGNSTKSLIVKNSKYLMGTEISVLHNKKIVVLPQFLGTEPIYYASVIEDFINIATVATLALRKFARLANERHESVPGQNNTSPSWSERSAAGYADIARCLSDRYKFPGSPLTEEQFDDAFSVIDAIEAARNIKIEYDEDAVKRDRRRAVATNALFFRRACLPLCGSVNATPGRNDLSHPAAHAGCNFGVAKLPEFHQAFSCRGRHRMLPLRDCFR
ncbi:hypothetical protein V5799_004171 [Amblyomma americanum]|uniref:Peptidase M13 N-terminal domain-containing protein n=1 Tax=Amblyomma americanum TaxID=6943 RepID=A0AAQ4D6V3_AMBAM